MENTKALEDLIGQIAAVKWNGGYDRNGSHDAGEYVDYEGAIGEVLNHDQMHAIAEWVDAQLAESNDRELKLVGLLADERAEHFKAREQLAVYKTLEEQVFEFGQKLDFRRGETISAVKVIHQAEKQLAERDAQLAAAKRTITKLQHGYAAATEWALASVDGPSKQMPKYEVDRLKKIATDMVHNCAVWRIKPHKGNTRLVSALQSTRQPTQDKGE